MQISLIPTEKLAELAKTAHKQGLHYAHIHSKNILAIGADPLRPTHVIDLTEEAIRPISGETSSDKIKQPEQVSKKVLRRTGDHWVKIHGSMIECVSLKGMLAEGLKAIEAYHPGTLEDLSKIMPRSKRIVARDPQNLFKDQNLARKYSEKLTNGWWFGTNNSADETLSWLRRAAEIARLTWGKDIETSLG